MLLPHFVCVEVAYAESAIVFLIAGANNLIPMEIALKIANKIRANERFAVYIVIPMWPEGVPTGAATQRILFWQVASVTISDYLVIDIENSSHYFCLISEFF